MGMSGEGKGGEEREVRRGREEANVTRRKVEPGTKSLFASEFLIINDASKRIIINKQR